MQQPLSFPAATPGVNMSRYASFIEVITGKLTHRVQACTIWFQLSDIATGLLWGVQIPAASAYIDRIGACCGCWPQVQVVSCAWQALAAGAGPTLGASL